VVSTSLQGFQYTYNKLGAGAVTNPLLDSTMLCVEGVAVLVRGEQLGAPSSSSSVERTFVDSEAGGADISDLIPDDQYLCTGLDLYVTHEPDLMTCMALVHSRIRRVYFQEVNSEYGALSSHYSFHSLRALNHHYRVFRVVPADATGTGSISDS
jgi:hypothetical protein